MSMATKKTVLVVEGDTPTINFFRHLGYDVEVGIIPQKDRHVAVVFPGVGMSDVDPALYGEVPGPFTPLIDPRKDAVLLNIMHEADDRKIPMIGICRGGQLLNVFNGGKLIQHVTGHHKAHIIVCEDGKLVSVNSSHHQMMVQNEKVASKLLAYDIDLNHPELLWYNDTMSLCIQCHPEWNNMPVDGSVYIEALIQKVIGDKTV